MRVSYMCLSVFVCKVFACVYVALSLAYVHGVTYQWVACVYGLYVSYMCVSVCVRVRAWVLCLHVCLCVYVYDRMGTRAFCV